MKTRLSLALLAMACTDTQRLPWTYSVAPGVRATRLEARIHTDGCDGPVQWASSFARSATVADRPPLLTHGRTYGFEVRALDESCTVTGTGCTEVRLPDAESVSISIQPSAPSFACTGLQRCFEGQCTDGGVDGGGPCGACCSGDRCVDGQCEPTLGVTAVATGSQHTCAIRGGELFCWGTETVGELGSGAGSSAAQRPRRLDVSSGYTDVRSKQNWTCALRDDAVSCWGSNADSQLGTGAASSGIFTPEDVVGPTEYRALDVGFFHACAITTANQLACWGRNGNHQASQTDSAPIVVPTFYEAQPWDAIAGGGEFTCGLHFGALDCWGEDLYGNVGVGVTDTEVEIPSRVSEGTQWEFVATGQYHACAIDNTRAVYCWGKNGSDGRSDARGALGIGAIAAADTPQLVSGLRARALAASNHTCAVRVDGGLSCFGPNESGQLGTDDVVTHDMPTDVVDSVSSWTHISVGAAHSCAIDSSGGLWCWGSNEHQQIGVEGGDRLTPTRVCFE